VFWYWNKYIICVEAHKLKLNYISLITIQLHGTVSSLKSCEVKNSLLLWIFHIHYHFLKIPPFYPVLRQMNLIHIFTSYFSNIYFNIFSHLLSCLANGNNNFLVCNCKLSVNVCYIIVDIHNTYWIILDWEQNIWNVKLERAALSTKYPF